MAQHRARVAVGGLEIAYERRGEGPPLVLLHGYVGDGPSTWGPQLDALSDAFTVVAWDTPGAGASADPPESFTLADYADVLAAFIDALRLERPHVAGLSWGGGLALELARRHPGLPRSLVLASAYAGWAGSLPPAEVERRLQQVLDLADLPADRFAGAVLPTLFSPGTPPERMAASAAGVAAFHPAGLRAMARAFAAADLRDALPGIAMPALLVYGDLDVRAPLAVAEQLRHGLPAARLVVLPGVGHLVTLEAPERLQAEMRAFLSGAG
jgi:pimeloyl-ACP methyl ester carboxylesterase